MGQHRPPHPHDSQSNVQSELAELRARYRQEIPGKIAAVKEAAAALGSGHDRQGLEALHVLAHRLVGSAAIYGFAAASEAAAALEASVVEALEGPAPPGWTQRLQTLVAALERAAAEPN
jgi:HPt (histidine-containing phosphotransfer) domain-containing protein